MAAASSIDHAQLAHDGIHLLPGALGHGNEGKTQLILTHAKLRHGSLDRDGAGLAEERVDEGQQLQLDVGRILEIAFQSAGTKKLMANYAKLQKI